MIKSMTGFARRELNTPHGVLSWELRSVNHRFLDVSLRMPEEFRAVETTVRSRIAEVMRRGKIDGGLRFHPVATSETELSLNDSLVKLLLAANDKIEGLMENPARPKAMDILRWPGVLEVRETDLEEIQQTAVALFDKALAELVAQRQREGADIQALMVQRRDELGEQVTTVRACLPEILAAQRKRLGDRLAEFRAGLDESRLEQEVAYIAQKIDVQEELDRIDVHLAEVGRVLEQDGPVGRRLDFLMQELNREANTLGSKSVDTRSTRASVEMKVVIEQMREQIQNIE